jgi:CMP-N,N'-diacetyllegionaminic acid synthase
MKTLALILARGGSKRLPGKNIKILGDKPLIAWSIDFAQLHPEIDRTVVSTDDPEIAEVARRFGVDVPWLRPAELATDTATSADAVIHALLSESNAGRNYDFFVLLQPTTPFRDPVMLSDALKLSQKSDGVPVVAVGQAKTHPYWTFKKNDNGEIERYIDNQVNDTRSQDLPPAYEITGSLYVVGVKHFQKDPRFFTAETRAVASTDRMSDCDIDDENDWFLAENIARAFCKQG